MSHHSTRPDASAICTISVRRFCASFCLTKVRMFDIIDLSNEAQKGELNVRSFQVYGEGI